MKIEDKYEETKQSPFHDSIYTNTTHRAESKTGDAVAAPFDYSTMSHSRALNATLGDPPSVGLA